jgi:hypothetical protein
MQSTFRTFELSRWRDGRYACVKDQVFVQTETVLL